MLKKVNLLEGQNLSDIAIQELGIIEGIFDLALANNISMTEILPGNTEIVIDPEKGDQMKMRQIRSEQIIPATNTDLIPENVLMPGGIGYMAVGIDFIVN